MPVVPTTTKESTARPGAGAALAVAWLALHPRKQATEHFSCDVQVGLDDELMKTFYGRESPGPCTYGVPGGLGKQPDSKYPSEPAWRQVSSRMEQGADACLDACCVAAARAHAEHLHLPALPT